MKKTGLYGENVDVGHIPGSDGWPLVGHTFDFLIDNYAFGKRMAERYGEVYRCRAFWQRFLVFTTPDGAELVLRDIAQNFSSRLGWQPFLGRLFPNALPTIDFEEHRRQRRIMQAVFRKTAMESYSDLLNDVVEAAAERWARRDVVRIYPAIKELTLEIAGRAFLGLELKTDIDFINRNFVTLNNGLAPIVPFPVPGLAVWRALRARRALFDYFRPLVAERRGSSGRDVFTRLCQAEDEDGRTFDDEAILYHLVNILSAAHDTSTTSITIVFYYLSKLPEWQERLREASLAVGPGRLAFEDLERLEVHEWVMKEALRIYPPAPSLFRRSVEGVTFKGVEVPPNTQVVVDVGRIHRDAAHWTDPMRFDPERFSPGREEHTRHTHQFLPFGGGAHTCIGNHFAMMASRIILHHLLTRFSFERTSEKDTRFTILPITQPKDGLPLRIRPLATRGALAGG